MRILVVTNLYPNPFEPTRGLYNRHQIRHLAERHEVTVISPILWTDEWSARRVGKPPLLNGRSQSVDGIEVHYPRYFYTPKVLRGSYGRFYQASVRKTFDRVADVFRPDVVFAPWVYPDGWAAVELSRSRGLPAVVKIHGSDIHQLVRFPARLASTVSALKQASAVVVVSKELKERVIQLGIDAAKVRVVYNGVDTDVFCPGDRQRARTRLNLPGEPSMVLAVGNLVAVKAHRILLEAIAVLARKGEELSCHIVGEGPLRASLEAQAKERGIADRVTLHGARPHEELVDWYRAADLVALPSLAEGIPNVLLEAMACGTPFVASRVGGIAEVAAGDYACRLVPPADPQALAAAMGEVLVSTREATCCAVAARSHHDAASEIEQCLLTALSTPSHDLDMIQRTPFGQSALSRL